jgi:hypothetical protein
MKYLLITIIVFVTTYLAFAYCQGEFNPMLWEKGMRAAHIYVTVGFSILASIINGLFDSLQ